MRTIPLLLLLLLCGCTKWDSYEFRVTAVQAANMDNSGKSPIPAGDSVYAIAYALQTSYEITDVTPGSNQISPDKYERTSKLEHTLDSFVISALQDFGPGYPAGSTLNNLFLPNGAAFLDDFYKNYIADLKTISKNNFMLMQAPAQAGNYNFIIRFFFNDGRVLGDTTEPVKLYR